MASYGTVRGVSFGFFVLALGCFLASFFSSFWFRRRDVEYNVLVYHGLWELCDYFWVTEDTDICKRLPRTHLNENSPLRTVQASMCMSFITAGVTLPLYIAWMARNKKSHLAEKTIKIGKATLSFCLITGLLNFAGILTFGISYGMKFEEVLNWGFALAVGSAGIYILNGLICLISVNMCVDPPDQLNNHNPHQNHLLGSANTRALPSVPVVTLDALPSAGRIENLYTDSLNMSRESEDPAYYASSSGHLEFHQNSVV